MRYLLLMLLSILGVCTAQAQDMRLQVKGDLLIDTDGRVADYTVEDKISEPMRVLLDKSVRSWAFEPTLRDGQAVRVRTQLHLTLAARKRDSGDYLLQVEQIRFTGMRKAIKQTPPRYPSEAARANISGDLLMAVRINAEGKVVDVAPVQASLPYRKVQEKDVAYWGKMFERSAREAMRDWRYEPADPQSGETDTTLIVPIGYRVGDLELAGDGWRRDSAGPAQRIPWLSESDQQFDPSGLKEGENIALGAQPVFKTPVLGTVL
jgi:hypothetical protein